MVANVPQKKLSKQEEIYFDEENIYMDVKTFLHDRMAELSRDMKHAGPGTEIYSSLLRTKIACNNVYIQINDLHGKHELIQE